jgi:outer membrane protein OmpA-like peptidoglycan-associated protein
METKALVFALLALFSLKPGLKAQEQSTNAYNNFDFIPGEVILFEDNFADSQDGEFPPRWNLLSGQGVVNLFDGQPTFVYTAGDKGSIARIEPAMKTKSYLSESFTIELDYLLPTEDQVFELYFMDDRGDDSRFLNYEDNGNLSTTYFPTDLQGSYQGGEENFKGKWHHASLAFKNQQIKCYVDQYRQLVIPKCGFNPVAVYFGGCSETKIRNVKIASGGGMNMLGKILSDGKFVSHAIKFDVAKSTIKGESMGFINELAQWLKDNPGVKIEIGGYTDSDGDENSNLKLSQARAEAVKAMLVSLGIENTRLTSKGYGESNPIDVNTTPEGKANNRRVELTKK